MKFVRGLSLIVLLAGSALQAGQFLNLDFESPNLPLPQGNAAFAADAFPGWIVNGGAPGPELVALNDLPLSGAAISLFGPRLLQANPNHNLYSARLYSGVLGSGYSGVSISQVGRVPESANSLRMEARINGDYQVTLGGVPVAMSLAVGGADYDTYYGDISGFSGQTVELKIETAVGPGLGENGPHMYIGAVGFSALTVPEPGGYALLGVGLVGFGCWRRLRA